jgi:hypothetical protein
MLMLMLMFFRCGLGRARVIERWDKARAKFKIRKIRLVGPTLHTII